MPGTKSLVMFHHPRRKATSWYLGIEEGNKWTTIGRLKIEPEEFVAYLAEIMRQGLPVEIKVDRSGM